MKNILLLLILFCFTFSECRKKNITDVPGLPAATQEGKNTLGFLLNGHPWTPKGFRVASNLSIDYDPGFNHGIFGIVAYNFDNPQSEQFIIGLKDSLNFVEAPYEFHLNRNSLYGVSFNTPCDYFSELNEVSSSGSLKITKLDRTKGIIAGTFNATLIRVNCIEIKITEGRFDMKF